MDTELMRTIVDGLNSPPFNRGLSLVKLDSMSPEKLLQTLSDVLSWIEGQPLTEFVDIRAEAPDETAMRILGALRILKYPPPRDIDQIQRWRLDILEGNKLSIYPILKWLFEDVDRLKERVYLGMYLTRIEVPLEEQSPEVVRLMNAVEQKMEEFKILHAQNVETRTDFLRAVDVRNDLKAMEEEREQLQRKIERCKRRTNRRQDMGNLLLTAERLRLELERNQELQVQRQDQQKAMANADQRLARLERALAEEERRREGADPRSIIQKLRREIEVNRYLLNDKLEHDLHVQRNNREVIQRILAQRNATKADIEKLKEQIEQLNSECMELALQRDRRDEASEDKLVVYRHQAANVQRKKANVADLLQMTKQELENTELLLAAKKRELSEKTGKDEVVTSVQYKALLNKLRNKSNVYKRKKTEMEQLRAEQQILERTLELLEERFEQIKENNQSEGRGVIEQLDDEAISSVQQRPKTAKPTTTDVQGLKQMVEQITEQINQQRSAIDGLNREIEQFHSENKDKNERFYALKAEFATLEDETKREREDAEQKIAMLEKKLEEARAELEKTNEEVQKQRWLAENSGTMEQAEYAYQKLERQKEECTQHIASITRDLNSLTGRADLAEQTEMWQNLVQLFELKLKTHQQQRKSNDEAKPWGDHRTFHYQ